MPIQTSNRRTALTSTPPAQVLHVKEGNTDFQGIRDAIAEAKACTDKPTMIKVSTLIGYGSPNKADSHDAHGAPLGKDETALTRANLKWDYPEFTVPDEVYETMQTAKITQGAEVEAAWKSGFAEYSAKCVILSLQFPLLY